jgi:hypothetical protein
MKNNKKQLNFALLIYACSVHAKISLFVLTVFILSHACKCENLCEYFHNIKRGFIYLILKGYLFTVSCIKLDLMNRKVSKIHYSTVQINIRIF